jgi:hypothetical protein
VWSWLLGRPLGRRSGIRSSKQIARSVPRDRESVGKDAWFPCVQLTSGLGHEASGATPSVGPRNRSRARRVRKRTGSGLSRIPNSSRRPGTGRGLCKRCNNVGIGGRDFRRLFHFQKKAHLPLDASVSQKIIVGFRAQETDLNLIAAMCPADLRRPARLERSEQQQVGDEGKQPEVVRGNQGG